MIGLIQRVSRARVQVDGETCGEIGVGLLVLLGVQRDDTQTNAEKLATKTVSYRIFPDQEPAPKGKMNRSLRDVGGGLLVVPQFTLAADTRKGLRPSFSSAAAPELAEQLYEAFVQAARREVQVETGRFGADMQVELLNDGPVTFLLEA